MSWKIKANEGGAYIFPTLSHIPAHTDEPQKAESIRDGLLSGLQRNVIADVANSPAIAKYKRLQSQLDAAEKEMKLGPERLQALQAERERLVADPPDDFLAQVRRLDDAIAKASPESGDDAIETLRRVCQNAKIEATQDLSTANSRRGFELREKLKPAKDALFQKLLAKITKELDELAGYHLALARLDDLAGNPPARLADVPMADAGKKGA